jgi:hypothetical protein
MCFVFIWEQTATCDTYSVNWLIFITEMKSVYSAVRTGPLNKAVCALSLYRFNYASRITTRSFKSSGLSCYVFGWFPTFRTNRMPSSLCAEEEKLHHPATIHTEASVSYTAPSALSLPIYCQHFMPDKPCNEIQVQSPNPQQQCCEKTKSHKSLLCIG